MSYSKNIKLSAFLLAMATSQFSSATSLYGTVPSTIKYSFLAQQSVLMAGLSTENATGWNCNSGINAGDQIGNLALVATFYQNGCYTDGRYNNNDYLVKRGVVKNASGTLSFPAYNITEPTKKFTQFLASTHVIYYKFPTAEAYSIYTFNAVSKEINKVASIPASQVDTTQFIKIASLSVSDIKGSVTYIIAPSRQRVSVFTAFSPATEGAQVMSTALLNVNKLRYPIAGQLYDTRSGFNFGPSSWDNRYGQGRQFFLGYDASPQNLGIVWQDQANQAIRLSWANRTARNTVALPNTRNELLAAATFDNAGNLYYLTIQSGNGKPTTPRTVTLYKVSTTGTLLLSRSLDASSSGLNMVQFFPTASLQYSNGKVALMLGRTMMQSGDGLNHQGGIAVVFDANTLEQLVNWGQTSGHSFGNVLISNAQNEFVAIDLGDNYPRGINLHRFTTTEKNSSVVYSFKTQHGSTPNSPSGAIYPKYTAISTAATSYYQWSNDNSTYTELGGVVENLDSYSVFFVGEPSAIKKSLNNARVGSSLNDARDIGMVKVARNFFSGDPLSSIVLTQGISETGGFYSFGGSWSAQQNVGIVWIVDYLNKDLNNASRLKAVKLAENKILLLWEMWTATSYVNTFAMMVDSVGARLSTPIPLGSSVRLSRSDDPLVIGQNVYLVQGYAADNKIEIVELEIK